MCRRRVGYHPTTRCPRGAGRLGPAKQQWGRDLHQPALQKCMGARDPRILTVLTQLLDSSKTFSKDNLG